MYVCLFDITLLIKGRASCSYCFLYINNIFRSIGEKKKSVGDKFVIVQKNSLHCLSFYLCREHRINAVKKRETERRKKRELFILVKYSKSDCMCFFCSYSFYIDNSLSIFKVFLLVSK
jgi:hypothetical protein